MTAEGTLVAIDGRPALRFERRYRHPVERVWRAVTDPDEMSQWFPAAALGERAVGAELIFDDQAHRAAAREADEPTRADGPMFRGRVIAHDPPTVFSFTWGSELLRFELTADGDETVLVFTQLLSGRSVAARNGAGWHACLAALDALLGVPPSDEPADWSDEYDAYLDRMGPPLGTPGDDGSMTWERSTHVPPDQVRAAVTDPGELDAWGAGKHPEEPLSWDIQPTEHGTLLRLTHGGAGNDAELAATWHALLLQLDMYLAAGQAVPADPERWVPAYRELV